MYWLRCIRIRIHYTINYILPTVKLPNHKLCNRNTHINNKNEHLNLTTTMKNNKNKK